MRKIALSSKKRKKNLSKVELHHSHYIRDIASRVLTHDGIKAGINFNYKDQLDMEVGVKNFFEMLYDAGYVLYIDDRKKKR